MSEDNWRDHAACLGVEAESEGFFVSGLDAAAARFALNAITSYCHHCRVVDSCREEAVAFHPKATGVWAATLFVDPGTRSPKPVLTEVDLRRIAGGEPVTALSDRPLPPPVETLPRGVCPHCGSERMLTRDGVMGKHNPAGSLNLCPGVGEPPAEDAA